MYILAHFTQRLFFIFTNNPMLSKQLATDTEEGIFGPGCKPVQSATVYQRWELTASDSQLVSHWRHAKYNVQIVSDSFHECLVNYVRFVYFILFFYLFDPFSSYKLEYRPIFSSFRLTPRCQELLQNLKDYLCPPRNFHLLSKCL